MNWLFPLNLLVSFLEAGQWPFYSQRQLGLDQSLLFEVLQKEELPAVILIAQQQDKQWRTKETPPPKKKSERFFFINFYFRILKFLAQF
jgi:hypothetical protein